MKTKIIEAALEEIRIHALRFKMDDVSIRLSISKKTLYNVFSSKIELVNAVMSYIIANYNFREKEIMEQNISGEDKTRLLLHLYSDSFWHFDRSLYTDLRHDYAEQWQKWIEFRNQKINILIRLLSSGVDEGRLRPIDLRLMMHCIWLVVDGLFESDYLKDEGIPYSDALEQYVDIIFNGIKIQSN